MPPLPWRTKTQPDPALPVTWDEAMERLMSSAATPGPGAP
jgi:hypothetical protein